MAFLSSSQLLEVTIIEQFFLPLEGLEFDPGSLLIKEWDSKKSWGKGRLEIRLRPFHVQAYLKTFIATNYITIYLASLAAIVTKTKHTALNLWNVSLQLKKWCSLKIIYCYWLRTSNSRRYIMTIRWGCVMTSKRLKPVTRCLFQRINRDIFTKWKKKNEYKKLLGDNITKTYKKSNGKKLRYINSAAKK